MNPKSGRYSHEHPYHRRRTSLFRRLIARPVRRLFLCCIPSTEDPQAGSRPSSRSAPKPPESHPPGPSGTRRPTGTTVDERKPTKRPCGRKMAAYPEELPHTSKDLDTPRRPRDDKKTVHSSAAARGSKRRQGEVPLPERTDRSQGIRSPNCDDTTDLSTEASQRMTSIAERAEPLKKSSKSKRHRRKTKKNQILPLSEEPLTVEAGHWSRQRLPRPLPLPPVDTDLRSDDVPKHKPRLTKLTKPSRPIAVDKQREDLRVRTAIDAERETGPKPRIAGQQTLRRLVEPPKKTARGSEEIRHADRMRQDALKEQAQTGQVTERVVRPKVGVMRVQPAAERVPYSSPPPKDQVPVGPRRCDNAAQFTRRPLPAIPRSVAESKPEVAAKTMIAPVVEKDVGKRPGAIITVKPATEVMPPSSPTKLRKLRQSDRKPGRYAPRPPPVPPRSPTSPPTQAEAKTPKEPVAEREACSKPAAIIAVKPATERMAHSAPSKEKRKRRHSDSKSARYTPRPLPMPPTSSPIQAGAKTPKEPVSETPAAVITVKPATERMPPSSQRKEKRKPRKSDKSTRYTPRPLPVPPRSLTSPPTQADAKTSKAPASEKNAFSKPGVTTTVKPATERLPKSSPRKETRGPRQVEKTARYTPRPLPMPPRSLVNPQTHVAKTQKAPASEKDVCPRPGAVVTVKPATEQMPHFFPPKDQRGPRQCENNPTQDTLRPLPVPPKPMASPTTQLATKGNAATDQQQGHRLRQVPRPSKPQHPEPGKVATVPITRNNIVMQALTCRMYQEVDFEEPTTSGRPITLGKGSFGEVRLMRLRSPARPLVAVKTCNPVYVKEEEVWKEMKIIQMCQDHWAFPKLYGAIRGGEMPAIVQEFVGNTKSMLSLTVAGALRVNKHMAFKNNWVWIANDVAKGLAHIHSKNYLHCDLKPNNILLVQEANLMWRAKIIDMGMACRMTEPRGPLNFTKSEQRENLKTFPHVPYEVITGTGNYSVQGDIYALGFLMLQIAEESHFKKQLKDLGSRCYKSRPSSRPALSVVIQELTALGSGSA